MLAKLVPTTPSAVMVWFIGRLLATTMKRSSGSRISGRPAMARRCMWA